jgi:arsenate reductase
MILKELDTYIATLDTPTDSERIAILDQLVTQITSKESKAFVFVCTHNSTRSQMSHVWAHVFASHFEVEVATHSAGTEATAFNIRAVDALRRAGMDIEEEESEETNPNPVYLVRYSDSHSRIEAWSKTLEDASLPTTEFSAVMTCSDADENCPFLPGASARIPLRYTDPKRNDDTPEEMADYDARCKLIASELAYVMSKAAKAQ